MKWSSMIVRGCALFAAPTSAASVQLRSGADNSLAEEAPGTITQVVAVLQEMLDKSREEGRSDRDLYAKYKCYCDENKDKKETAIAEATKKIAKLENELDGLLGSNAELSQEVAKLKADMDDIEQQINTSETLRTSEHATFLLEEQDLDGAVTQLEKAIDALAAIGADQTLASAAHEKFMAGYNETTAKRVLASLTSILTVQQRAKVNSLLQRGTRGNMPAYVSQSGEVFGILKSILETFQTNLAQARSADVAAESAFQDFKSVKQGEWDTMKAAYDGKQTDMGTNDGDLSTKKTEHSSAKDQKESDEEFLETLLPMCKSKVEDYERRKLFRANEEAAIAEAMSLLNSDAAFSTFRKVQATSSGATGASLLQVAAVDSQNTDTARRLASKVAMMLRAVASGQKSSRLARIAGLLTLRNPFTRVFSEIEKIKAVIAVEETQDDETLAWCNTERQTSQSTISEKNTDITNLGTVITQLEKDIDDPVTGLKKTIEDLEESLEINTKAQADETKVRREENKDYQVTIANCVEAHAILKRAIQLLEEYYAKLEEEKARELEGNLLQEDPAPPPTWEGEQKGQSEKGQNVITMLTYITSETQKEETAAHTSEMTAQRAYEDSMQTMKDEETADIDALDTAKKQFAEKKLELQTKRTDLDDTEAQKLAVERYLEEIKPGCDFITDNIGDRKSLRSAETAALDNAVTLLKGSAGFNAASAKDKEESFGECKATCLADEMHADCQACLAGVSVPGFCAGHAGTPGCS